MVSCGMFGNSNGEFLSPPNGSKVFTLKKAELRVFNRVAYNLWMDLSLILQAAQELPVDDVRGWQAVECVRNVVNICHTGDPTTWPLAAAMAAEFLQKKNGEAQHEVMATGHCHIDTAWLWPYSETRRKVARSWATQCTIMDQYSHHVFTASQAQQFEWMSQNYPELFKRIQEKVKKGQFVPIGGTWIEMDCNIPSGESFARQFLFGQKFFQRNFDGLTCKVFWLPDTFGYSSQLPQIMKQSECDFFLTQKLSWNNINKFPHNTFYWKGLDGTEVLSHFPPADTYVSEANVKDLVQGTKMFKTKDKSNRSMMLFGYGDGGGGPDPHHLERLARLHDVSGLPKVTVGHPENFFKTVEAEEKAKLHRLATMNLPLASLATTSTATDIPKWVGELYFELHRGTYTTHAKNKLGNRKGEIILQQAELLLALTSLLPQATATTTTTYTTETASKAGVKPSNIQEKQKEIEELWKLLLLNQFHDVLPGTSIGLVYKDSDEHYKRILSSGDDIVRSCIDSTLGTGSVVSLFNALSWSRNSIIEIPHEDSTPPSLQKSSDGNALFVATIDGMGYSPLGSSPSQLLPLVSVVQENDGHSTVYTMENATVIAKLDRFGRVISLFHKPTSREAIAPGHLGNKLVMFEDVPFFWDAWDVEIYHTEKPIDITGYQVTSNSDAHKHQHSHHTKHYTTVRECTGVTSKVVECGPLRAMIEVSFCISSQSRILQRISLDATSDILAFDTTVAWHEDHKFLKVEFPLNVHAMQAWYSTQFGCQSRPNHKNTTWDMAKFEVCGHYWADLNEFGFGVAVLNDCKYGYSCEDNVMRLSLLRSSKKPDDTADMGTQRFKYGLLAHEGSHADANLTKIGMEFNVPLRITTQCDSSLASSTSSLFSDASISVPSTTLPSPSTCCSRKTSLILETVKLPERDGPKMYADGTKWIILRLWESSGGRGTATFNTPLSIAKALHINILENPIQGSQKKIDISKGKSISIAYNPFEIITIALQIE